MLPPTASLPRRETHELLFAALGCWHRGLAILPIRPGTKEPHFDALQAVYGTTETAPLARRRASLAEVKAWFEADSHCGLAVLAGEASGGIGFVDIDALDEAFELVTRLHRLGGPVVATPRPGIRFWFRQREPIPARKITLPDGTPAGEVLTGYATDGRTVMQYALVPPSLHPRGVPYRWLPGRDLNAPLPEFTRAELEALLRDALGWRQGQVQEPVSTPAREGQVQEPKPALAGEEQVHDIPYLLLPQATGSESSLATALLRDPGFNRAALRLLGLDVRPIGKGFRCILHEERKPSASLFCTDEGLVLYRDWHERDGAAWFVLPEVYAAVVAGEVRKLRGPELAVWTLRLAVDAGVLAPARVDAPDPPGDLSPVARQVYEGFLRLLGCKWLHDPGAPTVFSWRFAASWCGVGRGGAAQRKAGEAMRELLQRGLIRKVVEHRPASGGRAQALFLPGLAVVRGSVERRRFEASKPAARPRRTPRWAPQEPCPACGGSLWWTTEADARRPRWACARCLEPPDPGRVLWWSADGQILASRPPFGGSRIPWPLGPENGACRPNRGRSGAFLPAPVADDACAPRPRARRRGPVTTPPRCPKVPVPPAAPELVLEEAGG